MKTYEALRQAIEELSDPNESETLVLDFRQDIPTDIETEWRRLRVQCTDARSVVSILDSYVRAGELTVSRLSSAGWEKHEEAIFEAKELIDRLEGAIRWVRQTMSSTKDWPTEIPYADPEPEPEADVALATEGEPELSQRSRPIEWLGTVAQLAYLIDQLSYAKFIPTLAEGEIWSRLDGTFVSKKGKLITRDHLKSEYSRYYSNHERRPRNADQIDAIVQHIGINRESKK